jgi:DNA-directed RNA polymerase specialized sigma24 family protein
VSRREIPVGLREDVLAYVEQQERPKRHGYVIGPKSDDSPWSALLWADLRRCYKEARIPEHDAMIFEWHIFGASYGRIAEFIDLPKSTVQSVCERTDRKIRTLKRVGVLTVTLEACGDWELIGEFLD